jgi:hypothetical protein
MTFTCSPYNIIFFTPLLWRNDHTFGHLTLVKVMQKIQQDR